MAGQVYIPPVQPVPTAPNAFGGNKPQQSEGPEMGTCPDCAKLTVLTGALLEVLIQKEILVEEEVLNAIATLQQSGDADGALKAPEGGKASGGGYPGAADTQKGTGNEAGKLSPSRT